MEPKGANRMEKQAATGNKRWVITVESRNEQHQEIIRSTLIKNQPTRMQGVSLAK